VAPAESEIDWWEQVVIVEDIVPFEVERQPS
jgi:hypothetical protein